MARATHTPDFATEPRPSTSVFRPAVLLMAGRFAAFAITAFVPLVLVRFLDQEGFGTYKQLFLISSTVYLIAPFGVATSLFYFLPKAGAEAGRYLANAMVFLTAAGAIVVGAFALAGERIAEGLNNPALQSHALPIGLFTGLLMVAVVLEIVMVCRGHYWSASAAYALSDALRAAGFLAPVLLGAGLRGLLWGGIAATAVRVAALAAYARREYGADLAPDLALFWRQLAYALPFGLAVVLEVTVGNFHHYFVSSRFDAATFAIYAAGCLQIPFVDFVAVPAGDVMMVKMREALARRDPAAALEIWHDTIGKLALIFFPMVALSLVVAHELIVALYTSSYAASAPVFMAWSLAILFSTVQVDGVLRVLAQTRFLVVSNLAKLVVTAAVIGWAVRSFGLVGAVAVTLLALLVAKLAGLARMRSVMGLRWSEVLPWGRLAGAATIAVAAAIPALAVERRLAAEPAVVLVAAGFAYAVAYGLLLLGFGPPIVHTPSWARFGKMRARVGQPS